MDFSAKSLQECFRMLHSLVRQWIHVWRQSMRFFGRISRSSRGGLWEMTSRLSPYSALSLVRFWIHALRQSTELVKDCACLFVVLVPVFTAVRIRVRIRRMGKDCACLSVVLVLIRTLCSLLPFTGPDALHHGRMDQRSCSWSFTRLLCATTYAYGSDCIKLWSLRSCSFFLFVVIPVVAQMQMLMVLHHRVSPAAAH